MMTFIDIPFVSQLITDVGAKLLEKFKQESCLLSLEENFQRFEDVNSMASDLIRSSLAQKYPHIYWSDSEFEKENQLSAKHAGEYWVCDPLDGAAHFLQGFPFWSMSLVLVRNGEPTISFVYDPIRNELFHAVRGEGAFLNGSKIKVALKKSLSETIVSTSSPTILAEEVENIKLTIKSIDNLMNKAFAVRMLSASSLQLAYVACGRLDGFWEFGNDIHDWLAGSLLAAEAGALVTDISGGSFHTGSFGLIAANSFIHESLQREVNPFTDKNGMV